MAINLLISFLAVIISITIHEFFHALVADKLGDPTPRAYGRLSLNPMAHIDPIGTILLPLFGAFSGFPVIGWAKPTPIDPYNFKNPRQGEIIVSLAGPFSNFLLAFLASLFPSQITFIISTVSLYLGIFNLIPIPPLDGSKILLNLLPVDETAKIESTFNRYSYLFIILLLLSGILSKIIQPIFSFLINLLYQF